MKSTVPVLAILFLLLSVSIWLISCADDDDNDQADDDSSGDSDDDQVNDDDQTDDDAVDDDSADDDTSPWEPVEPHRETDGAFTIVWLTGTPYEMGQQQGQLLHDELQAGIDWLNAMHLIDILLPIANWLGLTDLAMSNSYPDIVQECQGLVDTAGDTGWTMDVCMLLNFGDVLIEFLSYGFPPARAIAPGCTQVIAAGAATTDGRLYHGRSLDWDKIDYLIDYPVIFVRQPSDGIPHIYVGFPGNLSPYNGINAEGVSIASDEADPFDKSFHDRTGHSHVQMLGQLLKKAHSLEEATSMILAEDHMTVEIFAIADGKARQGAVFEMTAKALGVRPLQDDVVFTTNHFVAPETEDADAEPPSSSSTLRFDRVKQLIPPDGEDTYYGAIEPEILVQVLRDRINPYTGQESGADVFNNDLSIATNGAIYQIVFDPENLWFWVAAGAIPVPQQPFVGFSLGELLNYSDAAPCEPEVFP